MTKRRDHGRGAPLSPEERQAFAAAQEKLNGWGFMGGMNTAKFDGADSSAFRKALSQYAEIYGVAEPPANLSSMPRQELMAYLQRENLIPAETPKPGAPKAGQEALKLRDPTISRGAYFASEAAEVAARQPPVPDAGAASVTPPAAGPTAPSGPHRLGGALESMKTQAASAGWTPQQKLDAAISDAMMKEFKLYDGMRYKFAHGGSDGQIDCSSLTRNLGQGALGSLVKQGVLSCEGWQDRVKPAYGGSSGLQAESMRRLSGEVGLSAATSGVDISQLRSGDVIALSSSHPPKFARKNPGHAEHIGTYVCDPKDPTNPRKGFVLHSTSERGFDGKTGPQMEPVTEWVAKYQARGYQLHVASPQKAGSMRLEDTPAAQSYVAVLEGRSAQTVLAENTTKPAPSPAPPATMPVQSTKAKPAEEKTRGGFNVAEREPRSSGFHSPGWNVGL